MRVLGIIAAVVIALTGAFIWQTNQPDHYYRLGIEVETPDGVKSASSVLAVHQHSHSWGLPETRGLSSRLEGDAVFLDLGAGRNVVAILAHGKAGEVVSRMTQLDNSAFRKIGQAVPWHMTGQLTGNAPLEGDDIPTLVTFRDPTDPRTAEVIGPDELEAAFGSGYRFKKAWVEITDGPVSRNIEARLPWLDGFKGVTGGRFDPSWSNPGKNLYASHFRRTR
jgi:hypothetical protein